MVDAGMNHPNLLNDELTAPGNTLGTKSILLLLLSRFSRV